MSQSRYYYFNSKQKPKIGDKVVRAHNFWSECFNNKNRVFTVKHVSISGKTLLFKEIKLGWDCSNFKPIPKTNVDTEYKELFI